MSERPKIRPMSKKELAQAYRVSRRTLYAWLKPFQGKIGPYYGRMFTIRQINVIFQCIGEPE